MIFLAQAIAYSSIINVALCNVENDFQNWMVDFGRKYKSESDYKKAFSTWQSNLQIVEIINNLDLSWKASILTPYSDLTSSEFQENILLKPISSSIYENALISRKKLRINQDNKNRRLFAPINIESNFDWRDYGAVSAVQDQGSVGTCWAFSAIGNIEGAWYLNNNTLTNLSEEYLVDCDGSHDEKHADCGVFGGWPYLAYDFVIGVGGGGVPTEASYPYCSGTGECYPCMQGPITLCGPPPYYCDPNIELEQCPPGNQDLSNGRITSWESFSTQENEIAEGLVSIGPLSALLDATQLQFYSSGVWTGYVGNPLLGCGDSLNHAVLLVGYGTDSDNGMDYWTVKNSWGTHFGEEGYFRIQRGSGTCGINTAVTTSFV